MAPRRNKDASSGSFLVSFKARSKAQERTLAAYPESDVLLLSGPAGTGKTMAAMGAALLDLHAGGKGRHLLVLRPAVEAGRSLGYLKGDLREKIEPYMAPFKQAIGKIAFNVPEGLWSFDALGYQQGVTYDDTIVVVDEAQNCTFAELTMVLTRLGRGSKIILLGDPDQSYSRPTISGYDCDLDAVADALSGMSRVAVIEFPGSDTLRNPLIGKMLRRLESIRRAE